MREDYKDCTFTGCWVKDVYCNFTEDRVIRDTVPPEKWHYEVRHDDEGYGEPCQVKDAIIVNFFGTLITDEPIQFDENDECWLEEGDWEWVI